MWVVEVLDDVVDDIQAIFGAEDPLDLDCARFFRHAARLPLRGGAVQHAFGNTPDPAAAPAGPPLVARPGPAEDGADIAALAVMSRHPGFPTIGYSGAG